MHACMHACVCVHTYSLSLFLVCCDAVILMLMAMLMHQGGVYAKEIGHRDEDHLRDETQET